MFLQPGTLPLAVMEARIPSRDLFRLDILWLYRINRNCIFLSFWTRLYINT